MYCSVGERVYDPDAKKHWKCLPMSVRTAYEPGANK